MKISKEELKSLKAFNGMVLVEERQDTNYIDFGKEKLYIDTSYHPEHHQNVICKVISVPDKLIYSRKPEIAGMDWETEMLLKPGDIVWTKYLAKIESDKIECEDKTYYLIPYQDIYLCIRKWEPAKDKMKIIIDLNMIPDNYDVKQYFDDFKQTGILKFKRTAYKPPVIVHEDTEEIVALPDDVMMLEDRIGKDLTVRNYFKVLMLNGFVLFEKLPRQNKSELWMPGKEYDRFGIIRFIGKPNTEYRDPVYFDDDYIRVGDTVHLKFKNFKKLEYVLHRRFGNKKEYFITQRRYILGVVKKQGIMRWIESLA